MLFIPHFIAPSKGRCEKNPIPALEPELWITNRLTDSSSQVSLRGLLNIIYAYVAMTCNHMGPNPMW